MPVGTEATGRRGHLQHVPWRPIKIHLPSPASSLEGAGLGRRAGGASDDLCFPDRPPQLATSSFLLFLLTGIVSVAFLLLPLQDELGSQLPQILHVSLGQKLVAAYILGEHSSGWGRGDLGGRLAGPQGCSPPWSSFSALQDSSPRCSSGPELSAHPPPTSWGRDLDVPMRQPL